jgi:RNA polymerase sigma-70 factor (ECF subfamily)
MLVDTPELAPDLEWMLAGGQASPEVLAAALVQEYFPRVYRLALAILDDPDEAGAAAIETFVAAIQQVYRYPSSQGVRVWLFQLVLASCQAPARRLKARRVVKSIAPTRKNSQDLGADLGASIPSSQAEALAWLAVDDLPAKTRLAVLLAALFALPEAEIARVVGQNEAQLHNRLETAGRKVMSVLTEAGLVEAEPGSLLQNRWPPPDFSKVELDQLAVEIARQAGQRGRRTRRAISLGEMSLVAITILIVSGLVWGNNRLAPEPTLEPQGFAPTAIPTGIPVTMTPGPPQFTLYPKESYTITSLAERLGVPVGWLSEVSGLHPDQGVEPGMSLAIPAANMLNVGGWPTPVAPVAHRLAPLGAQSSAAEVADYLALSATLWKTLWADVQIVRYGPPGYVGPPLASRAQAWVSQPGESLQLSGPLGGQVENVMAVRDGWEFWYYLSNNWGVMQEADGFLDSSELSSLFNPGQSNWYLDGGSIKVIEMAEAAGRPALLVEWHKSPMADKRPVPNAWWRSQIDRMQLWIDAQTGVVLRERGFGGSDLTTVLQDYIVTAIRYDADFPELYPEDLTSGILAQFWQDETRQVAARVEPLPAWDPPEGHQRLPRALPLPGFDPDRSRLTFQYPEDLADITTPGARQAHPEIELFANGNYLGSLAFADPWTVDCQRTADGKTLIYKAWERFFDDGSYGDPRLYKLVLDRSPEPELLLEGLTVYWFALAPDGRRLAFAEGRDNYLTQSLRLLDLETGEQTSLSQDAVASPVWSPDGRFLSYIAYTDATAEQKVNVLDVESKKIVYSVNIDSSGPLFSWDELPDYWPSPDWPGHDWGVEFPVFTHDLGNCHMPQEVEDG